MQEKTERQRTHIVSPSMSFKTDKPPMRVFRGLLRIFLKRDFSDVWEYDGPDLGLSDGTPELVPLEVVLEALQGKDDAEVPWGGFRALLIYDNDHKITSRLKVKKGTKVKVKVKGTIPKTVWSKVQADIRKKFHVKV
ncbi:MAG: hypothetical protein LN414_00395 [Candidatus Thermoplasmatota archaeon]|nr:hypothetical protein [Candidatus Thermoplasmatota archaeon]